MQPLAHLSMLHRLPDSNHKCPLIWDGPSQFYFARKSKLILPMVTGCLRNFFQTGDVLVRCFIVEPLVGDLILMREHPVMSAMSEWVHSVTQERMTHCATIVCRITYFAKLITTQFVTLSNGNTECVGDNKLKPLGRLLGCVCVCVCVCVFLACFALFICFFVGADALHLYLR